MMGPPHEPLTFRDITEVFRREKRSRNITEIRGDFYRAIGEFLETLRRDNEEEMCEFPFSLKSLSISDTMTKARSKATQIFEIRAEKILLMALRNASGVSVVTDKLTKEEEFLFDETLMALSTCRSSALPLHERAFKGMIPHRVPEPPPEEALAAPLPDESAPEGETPLEESSIGEGVVEAKETIDQVEPVPAPIDERSPVEDHLDDHLIVRVLDDIPPFAGPERDYVLLKEDVVTLPVIIARALVSRGKAVEVNPNRIIMSGD